MSFPALSAIVQDLFDLPACAQRESNICSMVNFHPEARRLMDAVALDRIVEIGSEAGLNTAVLLEYVKSRGKKLVTVDPAEVRFPFSPEAEPAFTFYRETSAAFLRRGIPAEVIFMDGDHNYETVLADLKVIHENRAASNIKILFLHDVSWPWARQDIYYDPSRVAAPHPFRADTRVSPYAEEGAPSLAPADYMTSDLVGGPCNGVLTAVEDFLARGFSGAWIFRRIPVLYGIGILIAPDNLAPEERRRLLPLADELASHRELLSILELNRIENLCACDTLRQELENAGNVWRRDQSYIRHVNDILPGLSTDIRAQKEEIELLRRSMTEKDSAAEGLRQELEEETVRCEALAAANEEQNKEIDALRLENRDLRADISQKSRELERMADELNRKIDALHLENRDLRADISQKSRKLERMADELNMVHVMLWDRDREIRRQKLMLPGERRRIRRGFLKSLLPYSIGNSGQLKRISEALTDGTVKLLSLDIFDTLLFREFHSELRRFREIAEMQHVRNPEIGAGSFYRARALAHQLAYQTCPAVEGCREASAEGIFRIMAKILGLEEGDIPELMNTELEYEAAHLHLNRHIWEIVSQARGLGIPVVAVSDMYWGEEALRKIFERRLPEPSALAEIFVSSDYGVSKASGILFDRVGRERRTPGPAILHIGDNRQADCAVPFIRSGVRAFWLPRSKCYTKYCAFRQKRAKTKLQIENILHGVR